MIVTEGVRDTFRKRSKMMSVIRQTLEQQGFLEVETPVLESTAGLLCFSSPCMTHGSSVQTCLTVSVFHLLFVHHPAFCRLKC